MRIYMLILGVKGLSINLIYSFCNNWNFYVNSLYHPFSLATFKLYPKVKSAKTFLDFSQRITLKWLLL